MNIIFGDAVNQIPSNYVVLELDTIFVEPINHKITTWCVVDYDIIGKDQNINRSKKMHSDLMIEYRNQNWEECCKLIEQLLGLWAGEVDTFYQEIQERIKRFKISPPEPGWDGSVVKQAKFS